MTHQRIGKYAGSSVFRSARRAAWDSKPWQDRQFLLDAHGSRQFLAPTARECKGFEAPRTDWGELAAVIVFGVGFAILVWQPWRHLP